MIHSNALAWRKSSFSGGGDNGGAECVEVAIWRKSSFSGGGGHGGANCVEAAALPDDRFAIRDSKNPDAGLVLLPRTGMTAWLEGIKSDR